MKEIRSKKTSKQIICIIVMIMLCNFIIPNYSYAVSTESGGSLLKVMTQFVCFIADGVVEYLQDMFVSPTRIKASAVNYKILYAPGTIFAGQIPAFNINFINPMDSITVKEEKYYVTIDNITTEPMATVFNRLKNNRIDSDCHNQLGPPTNGWWNEILTDHHYNEADYKGSVWGVDAMDWVDPSWFLEAGNWVLGNYEVIHYHVYDNKMYFAVSVEITVLFDTYWEYAVYETTLTEEELQYFKEKAVNSYGENKDYASSSGILQGVVATWYNALRRIALVGLLSVLVYIGIRILLTSTSAKDKAKYKNMLKDWLVALCILFTLHYVMSITITVVDKINEVIGTSVIGEDGQDILMSTVRNYVGGGDSWGNVLPYLVIYCVLAVYTVIYTIQYFRRVIYLAFLTMIAPLITLTYPLDKIKDKKSQAFDMWLKDYIFFSLIQVVHLLLYYIFLGSSLNLANQGNWLFAIVAIGFLTKAEKIMKKMFGFEKSKTMGALAAGATGALVMNGINQLTGIGGKGGKGRNSGGQAGTGVASNTNIRTATTNPLAPVSTGKTTQVGTSGASFSSGVPGATSSSGSTGNSHQDFRWKKRRNKYSSKC